MSWYPDQYPARRRQQARKGLHRWNQLVLVSNCFFWQNSLSFTLVPSLDGCANGAKDDSEIKRDRLAPFVEDFVAEGFALMLLELGNLLKGGGVLGDKCTSLQKGNVFGHADLVGEVLDILEQSLAGDAGKRVLDAAGAV